MSGAVKIKYFEHGQKPNSGIRVFHIKYLGRFYVHSLWAAVCVGHLRITIFKSGILNYELLRFGHLILLCL